MFWFRLFVGLSLLLNIFAVSHAIGAKSLHGLAMISGVSSISFSSSVFLAVSHFISAKSISIGSFGLSRSSFLGRASKTWAALDARTRSSLYIVWERTARDHIYRCQLYISFLILLQNLINPTLARIDRSNDELIAARRILVTLGERPGPCRPSLQGSANHLAADSIWSFVGRILSNITLQDFGRRRRTRSSNTFVQHCVLG